jgi:hypothetical protein
VWTSSADFTAGFRPSETGAQNAAANGRVHAPPGCTGPPAGEVAG